MSLFTEQVQPKGTLKIEVFDKDGQLKDSREITNLVVSTGKNFVASRMVGTAKNPMSHMAIGSGTTAPDVGNTTLLTELGRVAITSATLNANSVTYSALFNEGVGTGSITEAGIFNSVTAGDMLARTTFGVVTKTASDSMSISWTVVVV